MYQGSFGPVSNRADWYERISLLESSDDTAPSVSEAVLTFGGGKVTKVTKKLSDAEITYASGILEFTVEDTDMRSFCAGSYPMGILLTIDGVEEQLFSGTLEVIDGVVP
jgi:hypothetical protein